MGNPLVQHGAGCRVAVAAAIMMIVAAPLAAQGRRSRSRAADSLTTPLPGVVSGALIDELPVDSVNGALLLQPGVGTSNDGRLTVRGAPAGEVATVIDGIPVTPGSRRARAMPGTNSVSQATVLTGPLSASVGNAAAGAVLVQTRNARGAALSFESDAPFGASSLGLNRAQAAAGGAFGRNFTFFFGGTLTGQKSAEPGFGAVDAPIFVRAGVDTTVTVFTSPNAPVSNSSEVNVYQYAVSRGSCETFSNSANADIANNYGLRCNGDRTPLSAQSNHQLLGKVEFGGERLRIGVLALRSREQGRLFNYLTSYLPSNAFGQSTTSDILALTFAHRLKRSGVWRGSLSRQSDRLLSGPLSTAGEVATRDPSLGFLVGELDFAFDFKTFPIDDQLIDNYRNNTQGSRRTPYDLANASQYQTISEYRSNAYGVTGFAEGGGPVGTLALYRERRTVAATDAEWQLDSHSSFRLGGELTRSSLDNYSSSLTSQAFSDVYREHPTRIGLFAEEAFRGGQATLTLGVRYDRFSSGADRPYALDTVSSSATFSTYQYFPRISSYSGTFQGDSLVMLVRDKSHSAFTPRARLTYALPGRTEVRAGYARQAQMPDLGLIYQGVNTDLAITSTANVFGTDIGFEKTWIAELGVRHQFVGSTVLDIAGFTRHELSSPRTSVLSLQDPTRRNSPINLYGIADDRTTSVNGGEVRLERAQGVLTGVLGYAYQHTGNGVPVTIGDPNFAATDARPHTVSAALALTSPAGAAGRTRASPLGGLALFAGFRYFSGTTYITCSIQGNESVVSGEPCVGFGSALGNARLPAFKQLDLRASKRLSLGHVDASVYIDARNALNTRNVTRVYASSGDIASPLEAQATFARDSSSFAAEAARNGLYAANGDVDLRFAGASAGGCDTYMTQGGASAPPNCVALVRAEQRFGNGDGIFTLLEQRAASGAAYAAFRGAQQFTASPRRVRIGIQIGL